MNIGKAFTFPFEDKLWVNKLGIGMAVSIVPILNFAWIGYILEIMRKVVRGDAQELPDWDNFGKKFMDGLIMFLATLIYSLPALLLIGVPLLLIIIPAAVASSGNMQDVSNAIATAGGFVFFCLSCVIILYALALSIVFPAIYVEYARQGTFASCFHFSAFFSRIGKNAGPFFTAWGVYLGTSLAAGILAGVVGTLIGWIPCLGQIVAFVIGIAITTYSLLVFSHLFGQFSKMETTVPPGTMA